MAAGFAVNIALGYRDHRPGSGDSRDERSRTAAEAATSACSRLLAGRDHPAEVLRDRLIEVYVDKEPRAPLIPNHPHCPHVVAPLPGPG